MDMLLSKGCCGCIVTQLTVTACYKAAAYTGNDVLPEGEGSPGTPARVLLRLTFALLPLAEGLLFGRRLSAVVSSIANHACCIARLKVC